MLTTAFDNLMMQEDETFIDFYSKFSDIVNSFALGEGYINAKVVKKILRSLPDRFHAKVTTIEEFRYLSKFPLKELLGSLKTYEMKLNNKKKKKDQGVALVVEKVEESGVSDGDLSNEVLALLM